MEVYGRASFVSPHCRHWLITGTVVVTATVNYILKPFFSMSCMSFLTVRERYNKDSHKGSRKNLEVKVGVTGDQGQDHPQYYIPLYCVWN